MGIDLGREHGMAEEKTTRGRTSTEDEVQPHGYISEEDFKAQVVEKVNRGDFTFNETQVQALVRTLGIEDEVDNRVMGTVEGTSPTAGLTPATGSGGTPYTPEAATEETKKAAEEAEKRVKKDEYPDNSMQRVNDKALAGSVKE